MGNGKFSDFGWHSEYNSGKKRKYSDTCRFLSSSRECTNKESDYYLSKCFNSTNCSLKSPGSSFNFDNKSSKKKSYRCAQVYHVEKNRTIEFYVNGVDFDLIPEINRIAIMTKKGDEFVFEGQHYIVKQQYEHRINDTFMSVVYFGK